jgi:hypothetical protein
MLHPVFADSAQNISFARVTSKSGKQYATFQLSTGRPTYC